MSLEILWEYFGRFNDREAARIAVMLMFVMGAPLVVGITAKLWIWAVRQVRSAARYVPDNPEITRPRGN